MNTPTTDTTPQPRAKSRRDRIKTHRAQRNDRRFYTADGRARDTKFPHITNRFSPYQNHMNKNTIEAANESIQDSEDIAALFSTSDASEYAATVRMLRGEEVSG